MKGKPIVRAMFAFAWLTVAGFPAAATAQFFYSATITSIDPATCTTSGASAAAVGTFEFSLPDPPNNAIITLSVNGGPPSTSFLTESPPSGGPFPVISITVPVLTPTSLPWTAVIEEFPAINGHAVGSGIRATAVCPASGPGTITFANVQAAGASVPALSEYGAAMLSVLLGIAAFVHRRRTRRSR